MDAPDNFIDFLELSLVATLRGRSLAVVVVGDLLVVVPATAVIAVSSSAAHAAAAVTPPMAASTLAPVGQSRMMCPVRPQL